jgi:hypothetical protein
MELLGSKFEIAAGMGRSATLLILDFFFEF